MDKKSTGPDFEESAPDQRKITDRRAGQLARLARVETAELAGKTLAEVSGILEWRIDPELRAMRRVCGRVVRVDPVTGDVCGVPNATVHVEDTDCSFIGYFPPPVPQFWLYPISCSREVIATVKTDACGRFCVYLPWWDIDHVLRVRRTRICLRDLYRPRLRDFLRPLTDPPIVRFPRPLPDPIPIDVGERELEEVRAQFGEGLATRLELGVAERTLGAPRAPLGDVLDLPRPNRPPPLGASLQRREGPRTKRQDSDALHEITSAMEVKTLSMADLDAARWIGPFPLCPDAWVVEWVPILDVPDITFRVTQDIDGDGAEETIYSEGYFDVRWDAHPIPDVLLEADATAVCSPLCDPVDTIPCESEPAIVTAGYMPLAGTHHDSAGYSTRVNRPSPTGDYPPPPVTGSGAGAPAVTPYQGTLNLHGCHRIGKATHYRLNYAFGSAPAVPFTGLTWFAPTKPGQPLPWIFVSPDPDGWYEIPDPAVVMHPHWLLNWPTTRFGNGVFEVTLDVGRVTGSTMTTLDTSDPVNFVVDNSVPLRQFLQVDWRYEDESSWHLLPAVCPVLHRQASRAVVLRTQWQASATHLKDAEISFGGCGAGAPVRIDPTPASPDVEAYRHWYAGALDNSVVQTNHWRIPASSPDGCYTLRIRVDSRAFNPGATDFGPSTNWFTNMVRIRRWATRAVSVVTT